MAWSDADSQLLNTLVVEGLTSREIAERMNKPRGTILSRIRNHGIVAGRFGLRGDELARLKRRDGRAQRGAGRVKAASTGALPKLKEQQARSPTVPRTPAAVVASMPLPPTLVTDVVRTRSPEPHECKWPIGDPKHKDFGFCGLKRRDDHSPYCAGHHARAYVPLKPRGEPGPFRGPALGSGVAANAQTFTA